MHGCAAIARYTIPASWANMGQRAMAAAAFMAFAAT
jgi:hypothetical protein